MACCRICDEFCDSNQVLNNRVFREKYQDIICMWLDVPEDGSESSFCDLCTSFVLEFHKFKRQTRSNVRNTERKKSNEVSGKSDKLHPSQDAPEEVNLEREQDLGGELEIEPSSAQKSIQKRPYRRKTAEEKAMTPKEYRKHYNKKMFERYRETCEVCGKRIPCYLMDGHMNAHKGLQPYPCQFCEISFNCRINLRKHIRSQHNPNGHFPCSICEKIFGSSIQLKRHFNLIHTPRRGFSCTVCGKNLATRYGLAEHMDIHTQRRNFACSICGKTFGRKFSLTIHTRTHTGETPYQCEICPKDFVHRRMYVVHMRELHPDEPVMRILPIQQLKRVWMEKMS